MTSPPSVSSSSQAYSPLTPLTKQPMEQDLRVGQAFRRGRASSDTPPPPEPVHSSPEMPSLMSFLAPLQEKLMAGHLEEGLAVTDEAIQKIRQSLVFLKKAVLIRDALGGNPTDILKQYESKRVSLVPEEIPSWYLFAAHYLFSRTRNLQETRGWMNLAFGPSPSAYRGFTPCLSLALYMAIDWLENGQKQKTRPKITNLLNRACSEILKNVNVRVAAIVGAAAIFEAIGKESEANRWISKVQKLDAQHANKGAWLILKYQYLSLLSKEKVHEAKKLLENGEAQCKKKGVYWSYRIRSSDGSDIEDLLKRGFRESGLKSGELWCERARWLMQLFQNDIAHPIEYLDEALKSLCHALIFTPQYGDTYVELFRLLHLLKKDPGHRLLQIYRLLEEPGKDLDQIKEWAKAIFLSKHIIYGFSFAIAKADGPRLGEDTWKRLEEATAGGTFAPMEDKRTNSHTASLRFILRLASNHTAFEF